MFFFVFLVSSNGVATPPAFLSQECRQGDTCLNNTLYQWLFLVPLKGGRWHIIPQLAVYTTYILPSGGLYATYHLLGEPETTIDYIIYTYLDELHSLGGGNSNIFGIFTPKIGEMIQFDEHIFHMGWFNHQPARIWMNDTCFQQTGRNNKHEPWMKIYLFEAREISNWVG